MWGNALYTTTRKKLKRGIQWLSNDAINLIDFVYIIMPLFVLLSNFFIYTDKNMRIFGLADYAEFFLYSDVHISGIGK